MPSPQAKRGVGEMEGSQAKADGDEVVWMDSTWLGRMRL